MTGVQFLTQPTHPLRTRNANILLVVVHHVRINVPNTTTKYGNYSTLTPKRCHNVSYRRGY